MASHPQSLVVTVLKGAGQDALAGWALGCDPQGCLCSESEYYSYHPGCRPRPPMTLSQGLAYLCPWAS